MSARGRSLMRVLRAQSEALLHGTRHRAARRRVAEFGRPGSILVVCYANVCRSPYLAAVLQRALPDVAVVSAGFAVPGRPVPEHSLTLAARIGLDLSSHRSNAVSRGMLSNVDMIIAMDAAQARTLSQRFLVPPSRVFIAGDFDALPGETRAIRDPWNQGIEVFEDSFARLDRCAQGLVQMLNGVRPR